MNPSQVNHTLYIQTNTNFASTRQSGKWCIFCREKDIDTLWAKIKEEVEVYNTFLGAMAATKLSSKSHKGSYVICVFTRDWTNKEDVLEVKKKIKNLGINRIMRYKRDADTFDGIEKFIAYN